MQHRHLVLDDEGNISALLRNDAEAQIYRRDGGTSIWRPIGKPITDVRSVLRFQRRGTLAIRTLVADPDDPGAPKWSGVASVDALHGDSLQVVVPDAGQQWEFAIDDDEQWPHPSDTGECVMISGKYGHGALEIIDVLTGTRVELPFEGQHSWLR